MDEAKLIKATEAFKSSREETKRLRAECAKLYAQAMDEGLNKRKIAAITGTHRETVQQMVDGVRKNGKMAG